MPTRGRPQIGVRVDAEMIERLDVLAEKLSDDLRPLTRADVIRYCVSEGLKKLERGLKSKGKSKRHTRKKAG